MWITLNKQKCVDRNNFIIFRFVLGNEVLCFIESIYNMFNVSLNRSMPVVIGAYRYIYVFHWNCVLTEKEKKRINQLLTLFLFFLPVCSTIGHIIYVGITVRLNVCMGREEHFFYNFENIFHSNFGALYTRYLFRIILMFIFNTLDLSVTTPSD